MIHCHRCGPKKIAGVGFLLFAACTDGGAADMVQPGSSGGDSVGVGSGMGGSSSSGASGGTSAGSGGVAGSASGGGGSSSSGGGGGAAGDASGGDGGSQPTSCAPARPHEPGRTTVDLQHDGNQRDYVLHVPTGYDGTQRLPLVLDIHGYTSFGTEELDRSKWDDMADAETFVVVAPDGINMAWNAGGCCGNSDTDDVGFIRTVVEDVASALCIDEKRVYVTGNSNGGAMTHKLGCEAADLFAAMAPICGWTRGTCNPSRPIAVAAVRALEDSTVQYEGGGIAPSAEEDLAVWLEANECEDAPVVDSHDDVCSTHTSCAAGTQVMECHPHGEHNFYYATDNLLLPDTLWPFFKQFALP